MKADGPLDKTGDWVRDVMVVMAIVLRGFWHRKVASVRSSGGGAEASHTHGTPRMFHRKAPPAISLAKIFSVSQDANLKTQLTC